MDLSADQCLALAQVYPVLLLAAGLENRALLRLNPPPRIYRLILVTALSNFAFVCAACFLAVLSASGDGVKGAEGLVLMSLLPLIGIQLVVGVWLVESIERRKAVRTFGYHAAREREKLPPESS